MRKIRIGRVLIFLVAAILVSFACFTLIINLFKGVGNLITSDKMFVASSNLTVPLYDMNFNEVDKITRGTELIVSDKTTNNEQEYYKIKYSDNEYYILVDDLVKEEKDIVKEKEMYVRSSLTLYEDINSIKIKGLVEKGEKVEVLGYDELNSDGSVDVYKVKCNDQEGYVYGKYLVNNHEDSIKNYDEEDSYQIHKKRGDSWGGGDAGSLDYYPYEKPKFEDNVMPSEVRSLYMNAGVVSNVDEYIKLAKESGINAIVVDIKDNTSPGYPANAMKEYSITNYEKAINSYEDYKNAIKKIKDAGLYVIGRITVFKDSYYSKDHPEDTILDTATGKSYNHDGSYWPSAFNRDVWEFNVSLAIESVKEMGFNEIQFDYVRFPDRVQSLEEAGKIDYNNVYDETKAQAIQRFVMYACDEIHKYGAYVSIDVFGESAHTYVTPYGQYWPAISNVADVISGMPYPDHFSTYEYGFKEPVWTIPYDLLYLWGDEFVMNRQSEIPTPAIVRTWIQAYDSIKSPYVTYDASMVSKEIQGLYDASLTGGFITWNGSSSLTKYKEISSAFGKEY